MGKETEVSKPWVTWVGRAVLVAAVVTTVYILIQEVPKIFG